MPRWTRLAVDVVAGYGRILSTTLHSASKAVLARVRGNEADEDDDDGEELTAEPMFSGVGVYARPLPAVKLADGTPLRPSGATEIVGMRFGDSFQPIAYRDLRVSSLLNPAEGEIGIGHYGGGFVALKMSSDDTGTEVTILAPKRNDDASIDVACALMLDPAQPAVALVNADGCALTMASGSTTLKNKDGTGWVSVDDGGVKVTGGEAFVNAQVITLYAPNGAGAAATKAHAFSMNADGDVSILHSSGAWFALKDDGIAMTSETQTALISLSGDGITIRASGNVVVEGNVLLGGAGGAAVLTVANLATYLTGIESKLTGPPTTPFAAAGPAIQATARTNAL